MYGAIEELYKKKSPYNILKIRMFLILIIVFIISCICNYFKLYFCMILVFLIGVSLIIFECNKVLNAKFYIRLKKRNKDDLPLADIVRRRELELFNDFCNENHYYNRSILLCMINHYRNKTKIQTLSGNLFAIIAIVVSIVMGFYTKDGFNFESINTVLPYLIGSVVYVIAFYFIYKQIIDLTKFFKGEDGMYERLEEIFSELYIECINNEKVNTITKPGIITRFLKRLYQ